MREIKFRAWQDNKMIYFESLELLWSYEERFKLNANDLSEKGGFLHDDFIENWYSNPTLMQYTGLLDEQGTEIFEGDIVKFSDNLLKIKDVVGVVEFKNGSFVINSCLITHYRWMDYVVEVIGNKFDNYEMIGDELNQEIHKLEKQIEDKLKVLDEYEGEM